MAPVSAIAGRFSASIVYGQRSNPTATIEGNGMSWLRRLIGGGGAGEAGGSARSPAPPKVTVPRHGRGVVSVPELDFVGQRSASPNRRYTLLWQDRYWIEGSLVGGRYLLIDGDVVAAEGSMERPQDGKVADDGTFILNDWGASDELCGMFHAFRADGSAILSRSYQANLLNNGLAPDGRLAVCQTCNAPGSPDSSILTVFDLFDAVELSSWTAESGWANGYEFPEGGERVRMLRHDRPPLDYSLSGEFLDRRFWLRDEVERGTFHVIRKALAEGEADTGVSIEVLRQGARKAASEGDERFRADAWRLLGEIEDWGGNMSAALEAYERALSLNPKVGVAKRAASLRKQAPS